MRPAHVQMIYQTQSCYNLDGRSGPAQDKASRQTVSRSGGFAGALGPPPPPPPPPVMVVFIVALPAVAGRAGFRRGAEANSNSNSEARRTYAAVLGRRPLPLGQAARRPDYNMYTMAREQRACVSNRPRIG